MGVENVPSPPRTSPLSGLVTQPNAKSGPNAPPAPVSSRLRARPPLVAPRVPSSGPLSGPIASVDPPGRRVRAATTSRLAPCASRTFHRRSARLLSRVPTADPMEGRSGWDKWKHALRSSPLSGLVPIEGTSGPDRGDKRAHALPEGRAPLCFSQAASVRSESAAADVARPPRQHPGPRARRRIPSVRRSESPPCGDQNPLHAPMSRIRI